VRTNTEKRLPVRSFLGNHNDLFDQKEAGKKISFTPVTKEKARAIRPGQRTGMATTGRIRATGRLGRDLDKASALLYRTRKAARKREHKKQKVTPCPPTKENHIH